MSMMDTSLATVTDAEPIDPAAITKYKPGQRSKDIVRREARGTVKVSTDARGLSHTRFDQSPTTEKIEMAMMRVVVNQPHRRDAENPRDARLAFPLWRFCLKAWPNDAKFREAMYQAGVSYSDEVRALKVEQGFHVEGGESDSVHLEDSAADDMSEDAIKAKRAKIEGMQRTLELADGEMRYVMERCPRAMVRLCCDHSEPSDRDFDMLKDGLYRLAIHYGHWRTYDRR